VRLIVIDEADAPALEWLVAEGGALVHSTSAALDMPAAILELAQQGGTQTPGGQFRVQFAALGQALGKGDRAAADQAGAAALAIAQEHNWPHLEGAVHFALASGLLSAGMPLDAVARYRQADAAGQKVAATGDPVGIKLRMQSAFATGAAYVAATAWAEAASTYEEAAAPLAEAAAEPLMVLDAWRMAGYCHEQRHDVARAWECGQKALDAAEAIPTDQRALSMLPYAGQGLLRIAAASPTHVNAVQQRMVTLLGTPDWQPQEPGGGE
jgi:tetratricopeptide (TPR) repeat protein